MPTTGSVTRTIRLDRDIDEFLRQFGEREGLSVNLLVNKAVRRLLEWDIHADKFGLVTIPTSLVERLMDYLTVDEAREVGHWVGANLLAEFITFWFNEVTLSSLVIGFPRLQSKYGRAFEYEEHVKAGKWTIVLKHGSGAKWSVYYEELLRTAFMTLLKTEIDVERTDDQVVARFSIA